MATRKIDGIDFENATEIFVSIFPSASPPEVLEHAERGQRNSIELDNLHEAMVFRQVATILRRRLAN